MFVKLFSATLLLYQLQKIKPQLNLLGIAKKKHEANSHVYCIISNE